MVEKEKREAIITAGKERHKGGLFLAEYSYVDRKGNTIDMCFTYREPTGAELQAYAEMYSKESVEAGRWLMKQVVVSTEGDKDILDIIGPHNAVVGVFYTEYINPLYGKVLNTSPIQSL